MSLKRILAIALVLVVLAVFGSVSVLAGGPNGQAGKSNVAHLYLAAKNPSTWSIVEDGAWGKMQYRLSGPTFNCEFNGHLLQPGVAYDLIYYPDPWPGNGLIVLGTATANAGGNVHIAANIVTGDLSNAKIWLVLAADVSPIEPHAMIGWNPTDYLFETALITFDAP